MRTRGRIAVKEPMTIAVDRLSSLVELRDAESLQRTLLGQRARAVCSVPILSAILRSGGLLLGAREDDAGSSALRGILIDLPAEIDSYPARLTYCCGVSEDTRHRGIASRLRLAERSICQREGIDLVTWEMDPLRSVEAHIAFTKLAAIGTAYHRHAYGDLHDRFNLGLATDRIRIEWWLEAPRVASALDHGGTPRHFHLRFHEMEVATRTRTHASGIRSLEGVSKQATGAFVLVEIPVDLDVLRDADPVAARDWRIGIRELLEQLLSSGYVVVGFVHEGGRSFHLLERGDRGSLLGRS